MRGNKKRKIFPFNLDKSTKLTKSWLLRTLSQTLLPQVNIISIFSRIEQSLAIFGTLIEISSCWKRLSLTMLINSKHLYFYKLFDKFLRKFSNLTLYTSERISLFYQLHDNKKYIIIRKQDQWPWKVVEENYSYWPFDTTHIRQKTFFYLLTSLFEKTFRWSHLNLYIYRNVMIDLSVCFSLVRFLVFGNGHFRQWRNTSTIS